MIVVSETSPLSGLAIAGYLGLLEQLYGRVLIPCLFTKICRGDGVKSEWYPLPLVWLWMNRDRRLIYP